VRDLLAAHSKSNAGAGVVSLSIVDVKGPEGASVKVEAVSGPWMSHEQGGSVPTSFVVTSTARWFCVLSVSASQHVVGLATICGSQLSRQDPFWILCSTPEGGSASACSLRLAYSVEGKP
jgi:hypothetical protein